MNVRVQRLAPRFIACVLVMAVSPARAAVPASERDALLDFYAATNGPHWFITNNWGGPAGTECLWTGVTCDDAGAHVVGIALGIDAGYNKGIVGTVPPSIRNLTSLQALDLSFNSLAGPMPTLTGWTSLRSIDLSYNEFTGSLPSLAGLPNLESADFSFNMEIRGGLPTFDDTPNLAVFRAAGPGGLTGTIPPLDALTHLSVFDVAGNFLEGTIPALSGFHELTYFGVGGNWLGGELPSIAGLEHLAFFDAAANTLDGTIPPLDDLPSLATFIVHDSQLSGPLPSLSGAPRLTTFLASNNALSGTLPSLAALSHLDDFEVENNQLSGAIGALPSSLTRFRVAGNRLTGALPPAPPQVFTGSSTVCPNLLTPTPDAAWDNASDTIPWYANCNGNHVNFNQFGLTGSWFDPSSSGEGVLLASMPDFSGDGHGFLFGAWFTFPDRGATNGAAYEWYTFDGEVDPTMSSATLTLHETRGGSFVAPPVPATQAVGSVTITLRDCRRGTMSWHFDDGRHRDGVENFWRVTDNTTCTIDGENAPAGGRSLLSGAWYDPALSGQGLLIDVTPSQNLVFASWFTFAPDGASGDPAVGQRWYVMEQLYSPPDTMTMTDVTIYQVPGGAFGQGGDAAPAPVGAATFTFTSCDTLTMDYGIAGIAPGTLHLQRIGPTPPGCE
jgi:hypothetical protein